MWVPAVLRGFLVVDVYGLAAAPGHNAPSWWSPGADAATTCDSNMWRSGGDIGNGFSGAWGEAHQWFRQNNLSAAHPWGAVPISRPGCWGYPDMMYGAWFAPPPMTSTTTTSPQATLPPQQQQQQQHPRPQQIRGGWEGS